MKQIEHFKHVIQRKAGELEQMKYQDREKDSQSQQLVMNLNDELNSLKEELKRKQERKEEEDIRRQQKELAIQRAQEEEVEQERLREEHKRL